MKGQTKASCKDSQIPCSEVSSLRLLALVSLGKVEEYQPPEIFPGMGSGLRIAIPNSTVLTEFCHLDLWNRTLRYKESKGLIIQNHMVTRMILGQ